MFSYFTGYHHLSTVTSCLLTLSLFSGYKVSNATFSSLVVRYTDKTGAVKFDDFVACLVKLKSLCGNYFV